MATPPTTLSAHALCTVEQVVAELKLTDRAVDESVIALAIEAASVAISRRCSGRALWKAGTDPQPKVFPNMSIAAIDAGGFGLRIGDAADVIDLADESDPPLELVSVAMPANRDPDLEPITWLWFAELPVGAVTVNARWGWPEVAFDVEQAAIKQSAAWYGLDSSRLSDSWSTELGQQGANLSFRTGRLSLLKVVRDLIEPLRYVPLA